MDYEMNIHDCADLSFLALTAWREARGESPDGIAAVCYSILNRVNRPSWWGNDILSVIFKKLQYSSLTDPKDRQLTKWPTSKDESWNQCLNIANMVLKGMVQNRAPGADSYYDVSIPAPYWATPETFVRQIGRIRFHNLDHDVEA